MPKKMPVPKPLSKAKPKPGLSPQSAQRIRNMANRILGDSGAAPGGAQ